MDALARGYLVRYSTLDDLVRGLRHAELDHRDRHHRQLLDLMVRRLPAGHTLRRDQDMSAAATGRPVLEDPIAAHADSNGRPLPHGRAAHPACAPTDP